MSGISRAISRTRGIMLSFCLPAPTSRLVMSISALTPVDEMSFSSSSWSEKLSDTWPLAITGTWAWPATKLAISTRSFRLRKNISLDWQSANRPVAPPFSYQSISLSREA